MYNDFDDQKAAMIDSASEGYITDWENDECQNDCIVGRINWDDEAWRESVLNIMRVIHARPPPKRTMINANDYDVMSHHVTEAFKDLAEDLIND